MLMFNRDISEAAIGPRSVVATSPDKLDECKWELEADTEKFIKTIEVYGSMRDLIAYH